jgi:carboxymethylenebutenolidase
MSEKVILKESDSSEMQAYVAKPQGTPKAGVIVIQEAFGVTAHIQRCADHFAKEGYLAISPEVFHRSAPAGFTTGYGDFELVKGHYGALTLTGLELDMKAAYGWLKDNGVQKVGSVGYCLGGRVSYIANSALPLNAAVSYYGRIAPDFLDRAKDQHAPVLFFWGGADKGIPVADAQAAVNALREAKKIFTTVEFSEAEHGFNCDDRPSFNAEASEQAWGITLSFFQKHLS